MGDWFTDSLILAGLYWLSGEEPDLSDLHPDATVLVKEPRGSERARQLALSALAVEQKPLAVLKSEYALKVSREKAKDRVLETCARIAATGRVSEDDLEELEVVVATARGVLGSVRTLGETPPSSGEVLVSRPFRVPARTVGVVSGMGSVGKTYVSLMVAMSVASTGSEVLYLTTEDPAEVLRARADDLLERMELSGPHGCLERSVENGADLLRRIAVREVPPEAVMDRNGNLTEAGKALRDAVLEAFGRGASLVVVDPLSPLLLNENDNAYAARLMATLAGWVRQGRALGADRATVLVNHHTGKRRWGGLTEEDVTADMARGASAITDTAKFAVQLLRLSMLSVEEVRRLCTPEVEAAFGTSAAELAGAPLKVRRRFLVAFNTKSNYFPAFAPVLVSLFSDRVMVFHTEARGEPGGDDAADGVGTPEGEYATGGSLELEEDGGYFPF